MKLSKTREGGGGGSYRPRWLALSMACGIAAPLAGCDVPDEGGGTVIEEQAPLVVPTGVTLWPNGIVRVCLRPSPNTPSGDLDVVRASIRRTLGEGWARTANVMFWDFSNCGNPLPTNAVEVTFDTAVSNSSDVLGMKVNGTNVVNFQWDHDLSLAPQPDLILHEFGHVLGFAHEQARDKYVPVNSTCPAEPTAMNADVKGTPLDGASIMIHTGGCMVAATGLSPWDIVGVQNAYGRKKQGVIVGMNNECVNIPNGTNPANGQNLQVYDCTSGTNEIWRNVVSTTQFLAANVSNGSNAMDIEGGGSASNTPVQVFTSVPAQANQHWSITRAAWVGMGNKCLEWQSTIQRIVLNTCNGSAAQQWDVLPQSSGFKIRQSGTSSCVTLPPASVSGADLTLAACGVASNNTTFTTTSLGEIVNSGLCLDTEFADPVNGRIAQVFTCKSAGIGKSNQQFFFRGPVVSGLGTCLSTPNTDFKRQDPLVSWACPATPGADFIWDVYLK